MIILPDNAKIAVEKASEYLRQYWEEGAPPVYGLFDATLTGPKNRIEPIDILSLNVLNAFEPRNPMTPMAVLWKQENRKKIEELLTEVTTEPIENLDESERTRAATALERITCYVEKLHGWGPTSASRLTHRFRPGLAPPWDEGIGCYYQLPAETPWKEYYQVAMDCIARNTDGLLSVLESALDSFPQRRISIVRLWDIILWVRVQQGIGSASRLRRKERIALPDKIEITTQEASGYLRKYWREVALPVYGLFDATLTGPKNRVEPIDILSLNVLNVFGAGNPMSSMAVLWKRENRKKIEELLTEVTPEPIENIDGSERNRAAIALERITCYVEKLDGWGPTSAAKLTHRFRPGLAPLWDTFVNRYYQLPVETPWNEYYRVAMDCIAWNTDGLLAVLESALDSFPQRRISIVRLWDIILWMRVRNGSEPKLNRGE